MKFEWIAIALGLGVAGYAVYSNKAVQEKLEKALSAFASGGAIAPATEIAGGLSDFLSKENEFLRGLVSQTGTSLNLAFGTAAQQLPVFEWTAPTWGAGTKAYQEWITKTYEEKIKSLTKPAEKVAEPIKGILPIIAEPSPLSVAGIQKVQDIGTQAIEYYQTQYLPTASPIEKAVAPLIVAGGYITRDVTLNLTKATVGVATTITQSLGSVANAVSNAFTNIGSFFGGFGIFR